MTTVQSVIDNARNHLLRGHRDERNFLNGAIATTSATTFTVSDAIGGIAPRAKVSIDLEDFYVRSVATLTATVQRGQFGSTAATHASGATVLVNPVVSDYELFAALNAELSTLSGEGLFKLTTLDRTYSASLLGYDLVADFIDVHEVYWKEPTAFLDYQRVQSYSVARSLPTTDFASGSALLLDQGVYPGANLRIEIKTPFTAVAGVADSVESVAGLHTEAMDLLAVGTALRCAPGKAFRRSLSEGQGNPRRAEESTTSDALNGPNALRALRAQLLRAESARLAGRYPYRRNKG